MNDDLGRERLKMAATAAGRRCPICGKPAQTETRPFCSRRCADVDLSRWLGGAYRIPVDPVTDEDGDRPEPRGGAIDPDPQ